MGMKKFCVAAQEAGLDGVLVTDLPVEEAAEYLRERLEEEDQRSLYDVAHGDVLRLIELIGIK